MPYLCGLWRFANAYVMLCLKGDLMKTLYLHIGTPKTGTTSIQKFCINNKELLKSKGYIYPESIHHYEHVSFRRNGHFLVGVYDEEGERNFDKEDELREQGFEMLEKAFKEYDNVILSDENIWHGSFQRKPEIWNLLDEHSQKCNYHIRVIVYLRRQDELALSWLNQQVKAGWNSFRECTWEYYSETPQAICLDYAKHINQIASVLGKDAMRVRIFEFGQFKGIADNIYSDFLDAIDLELNESYVIEEYLTNTSLNCNGQEIKRILNGLFDAEDLDTMRYIRNLVNESMGTLNKSDPYEYLSIEERKEFLSKFEEGNQSIAKEYLDKNDGKLFRDVTSKKEKWTPINPEMHEDIIRFFGTITIKQYKEIQQLKEKQKTTKAELKQLQTEFKKMSEEQNMLLKELKTLRNQVNSSITQKIKHYLPKKK